MIFGCKSTKKSHTKRWFCYKFAAKSCNFAMDASHIAQLTRVKFRLFNSRVSKRQVLSFEEKLHKRCKNLYGSGI